MARIRSIKPETFTSEDVNSLTLPARWTFVGLWCYVDDEGRGRADARLVKASVWPIDDAVTAADVLLHLDEMEKRSMICRYRVDDLTYLHVVEFPIHQRINRPTPSRHPECYRNPHGGLMDDSMRINGSLIEDTSENSLSAGQAQVMTDSMRTHGVNIEDSLRARKEQGTGNREQGTGKRSARRGKAFQPGSDQDPDFTAFWATYPKRVDKGHAREMWRKAVVTKHADAKDIIAAAAQFAAACHAKGTDKQYIPNPGTWLNGERWTDESGVTGNQDRIAYPTSPWSN
jgi:hypothetical protein